MGAEMLPILFPREIKKWSNEYGKENKI